jgi:hypothetical protein
MDYTPPPAIIAETLVRYCVNQQVILKYSAFHGKFQAYLIDSIDLNGRRVEEGEVKICFVHARFLFPLYVYDEQEYGF